MLLVGLVEECSPVPGKDRLKHLKVNIGDSILEVITNAPNVQLGTRTIIATLGTEIEVNGEAIIVEKQTVNGLVSEGVVCDSKMCGWSGGAQGIAVQIPDSLALGSPCPSLKPRADGFQQMEKELTLKEKKELEKQARKAALKEKRALKKEQKETDSNSK
jgi:tRNA-binding EMAP/Myf-like protein